MSTQAEIERTERQIIAMQDLTKALKEAARVGGILADTIEKPSPDWMRMLDRFRDAVNRIPTSIRTRF